MGSLKAPLGMCQCWNGHGFEDVWLALSVFLFSLKSENNTEIYAQACKCDWTSCKALEMQQVCPTTDDEPMWTKQHLALKKKSILFVLPDILMFIMRVLYYHDDYDYSCAILVYCCLNVTLFFYDMMRWKPWAWEWWPSFKKSETIWSYLYTEWMLQVAS